MAEGRGKMKLKQRNFIEEQSGKVEREMILGKWIFGFFYSYYYSVTIRNRCEKEGVIMD